MGLDISFFKTKKENIKELDVPNVSFVDGNKVEQIAYYRKHNVLQGYFQQVWLDKGGDETEEFNLLYLPLDKDDIQHFKEACINKTLKPTSGFFFGSLDEVTDEEYQDYLKLCDKLEETINNGEVPLYWSWW